MSTPPHTRKPVHVATIPSLSGPLYVEIFSDQTATVRNGCPAVAGSQTDRAPEFKAGCCGTAITRWPKLGRWRGVRWHGVAWPLRIRLASGSDPELLFAFDPPVTPQDCGCMVMPKAIRDSLVWAIRNIRQAWRARKQT